MAAGQAPWFLVALGACIVAAVRWSKHPMASLLVVVGLGVQFLARMSSMVLPRLLAGSESLNLVFFAQGVVGTLGLGAILAAVFVDRGGAVTDAPRVRW